MLSTANNMTTYPWRDGNCFKLLVNGEQFFPAMLNSIHAARHYVLLELYLIESGHVADRFIDAFINAAKRGIQVYLLLDDFGARGLRQGDRQRLRDNGVQLSLYNPLHYGKWRRNLFRDHRKLLIVDGKVAYVGGAGITDEFDPAEHNQLRWHETMTAIRGPNVLDWQHLFGKTWASWGNGDLQLPKIPGTPSCAGRPGRISINAPTRMEIKRALLKRIRNAERRVWIASAYFIPSRKIRRALRRAAKSGVDVRLLLPGPHTDHPGVRHAGRRYYGQLLEHGVRIFEYQPSFLHAKLLLCDDWVSTGSSNIDRWNFSWNLEANQEIEDQDFSEQVTALFEKDFSASQEISARLWRHRPWYLRLSEWFWGQIELWLERRSQQREMYNKLSGRK